MAVISREYAAGALYGKVEKTPRTDVWVTRKLSDSTIGELLKHKVSNYATNYCSCVAGHSTGFTKIGLQTLNESIETYCYAVLGSQAKTRVSIVNQGASTCRHRSCSDNWYVMLF